MITYPLNKIDYQATDAELFHCTRNSGIYASDDFVCTVTGADNNVTIGAGIGWIRNSKFSGKVIANKSDVVLDLGLADASLNRWDIVAIQFDKNNNATDLVVKHGTPASTPVRPEIVQTETLYELYLAAFYRKAGATTINASDVYDLRLDPIVCGLMADSVTEIDTTSINAQINALIEKLREEIAGIESSAEIMLKSVYDTNNDGVVDDAEKLGGQPASYYAKAENSVQTYTQSAGTLSGSGTNGKFKATATGTYTAFTIGGISYAVKAGSETEIELTSGVWYSFILDTEAKTINFKAGGAGLNFAVVGSTTEPSSPKENTIWLKTDTPVGEYQFSASQPTKRADGTALQNGDVWIKTNISSRITINTVKKNGIFVEIVDSYQYISGAWKHVECQAYQNSKWVKAVRILYENGVFYEGQSMVCHATGGGTWTQKSNCINVTLTNAGVHYVYLHLDKAIDMTNINTVTMTIKSNCNYSISTSQAYDFAVGLFVGSYTSHSWSEPNNRMGTFTQGTTYKLSVDVSNVTGSHYIKPMFSTQLNTPLNIDIISIEIQ